MGNVDDLRTTRKMDELLIRLEKRKIDIACIQETHNVTTTIYEKFGYCIQSPPSKNTETHGNGKNHIKEKGIGGVAVEYRKQLQQSIKQIAKHPRRIIHLAIRTNVGFKKCKF